MSLWRFASVLVVAHAQCVTKQTLKAGDGMTFPKSGDSVTMQYTGYLASNGQKFDSSLDHGGSFTTQIGVGKVITGWDQGVPQMTLGEHAMLHISADCGYGAQGAPPSIPPNADLNFDVVLLAINGQRAGASVPAAPAFPATLTATLGASFPSTSQASKLGKATRKRVSNGLPAQATVSFASTFPTAPATQSLPALGNLPATVVGASFPSSFSSNTQFQGSFAQRQAASPFAQMPPAAPAATSSSSGLPTCTPSDCGHAISWDSQGLTRPVCLCNPICQTMKDTPGVLPCCPGTQTVCLDPYRSPSPHPPVSFGASWQG